MSNYTYFSDDTFQPDEDQSSQLVSQIVENYKNWDNDRNSQREQYEKIEESLYIDITHNERNNDETVLLPSIVEQYNTMLSNIEKSNFQNEDMMFNVIGEDEESSANATLQKANLKDAMRKMNFEDTAHMALHYWLTKGEMISFTYWETKVENTRRILSIDQPIVDPITGQELGSQPIQQIGLVPKIVYDGAKVMAVDPLHFVFDKNAIKNWDGCNKIVYTLENPLDIVACDDYKLLTDEDKEFLKGIVYNREDLDSDKDYRDTYSGVLGNQVTVLECWGDIHLGDGTILKNYVATIVADMFLARLEPNPYVRNPFALSRWMPDPSSERGRSPLLVAIPINQVASQILNGQVRGLKLTLNPPVLAPMDMFTQDRVSLFPGKIVEYNDLFNGARPPQPYNFKDGLVGFDFLNLMENKIEAATGAFKYMVGSQDSRTRTATETSATVTGQNTRLSMTINQINRQWTIPTIENIAALQANTDFEEKQINAGESGSSSDFQTITPDIRQGNYRYVYGDSQSVVEMEAKTQKIVNLLAPFAGKVDINNKNLLKMIFQKMNIEGADAILEPDPIDKGIQEAFGKPIPAPMLQQLKEQFVQSGMLQQVMQQMMQQQQQAQQMQQGGMNGQPEQPAPAGNANMGSQDVGAVQQPNMAGA